MAVWMCGTCGETWERPSARHCSFCGAVRPNPSPARFEIEQAGVADAFQVDANTAFGPFVLATGDQGELVAWAGVDRDAVYCLRTEGAGLRASRLTLSDRMLKFTPLGDLLPRLEDLVCAPIVTRKGLFVVEGANVHRLLTGGRAFMKWTPPGGGTIVAAAASTFGEVWLAVRSNARLTLFSGGGEGGWTSRAFASGAVFPEDQAIGLAVQSEAPGQGKVLLWGDGRAIQFDDGAASQITDYSHTEPLGVRWVERAGQRIHQGTPRGGPVLLRAKPAVCARMSGIPAVETLPELANANALAMTPSGIAVGAVGGEMIAVDLRGTTRVIDRSPMSTTATVAALLPLGEQVLALLRVDNSVEFAFFTVTRGDRLKLQQHRQFQPPVGSAAVIRTLPPLLLDGEAWMAIQIGGRLRLWRIPVT